MDGKHQNGTEQVVGTDKERIPGRSGPRCGPPFKRWARRTRRAISGSIISCPSRWGCWRWLLCAPQCTGRRPKKRCWSIPPSSTSPPGTSWRLGWTRDSSPLRERTGLGKAGTLKHGERGNIQPIHGLLGHRLVLAGLIECVLRAAARRWTARPGARTGSPSGCWGWRSPATA